jgi:hypothetical protein
MKRKTWLLILVVLAVFSGTCKKENLCDCVKSTGDVRVEEREIAGFTQVYVEDNVNLVFVPDSTFYGVKVEAGSNLVGLIKTELVGQELRIRNDNKCNFVRRYDIPVTVYVHMPLVLTGVKSKGTGLISTAAQWDLDSIDLDVESSGDIDFWVNTTKCNIHQHGAGDITVRGHAGQVIIYCIGTGFVTTDACAADYSWVYSKGTGKITVAPRDLFIVQLDGPGSAYYRGQPELWSTVNGSGGVFQLP